jgi:DNA-directed RNA polymerase specialized sigma24 family protein
LRQAHDSKAVRDLEQSIQLKEAVRNMDEWTRKVWAARQYGYSWKEIATQLDLTEPQAKLRFRYAIGKLRARLGGAT